MATLAAELLCHVRREERVHSVEQAFRDVDDKLATALDKATHGNQS